MLHARLFGHPKAPQQMMHDFLPPREMQRLEDGPTIVQFCANYPQEWLAAARKLIDADPELERYQAVDLNLGCPQEIARRGNYGSFLQDDWDLIERMIHLLHTELRIPVTAKIRIFPDDEKTLRYAKMIERAGAQVLTVHGRLREQRGMHSGVADWDIIRKVKAQSEIPVIANGNIVDPRDVQRCLDFTGCDAVMSAETHLYNPAILVPVDEDGTCAANFVIAHDVALEYLDIVEKHVPNTSWSYIKSHLFKILKQPLAQYPEMRAMLGGARGAAGARIVVNELAGRVEADVPADILRGNFDVRDCSVDAERGGFPIIPWYRTQPYVRQIDLPRSKTLAVGAVPET